jgi:hypothetical protein
MEILIYNFTANFHPFKPLKKEKKEGSSMINSPNDAAVPPTILPFLYCGLVPHSSEIE